MSQEVFKNCKAEYISVKKTDNIGESVHEFGKIRQKIVWLVLIDF